MALMICERKFASAVTLDELTASMQTLIPCLGMRGIRWLGSAISKDGLRGICKYDAPDAESVRQANREAGCPFESVWPANELVP
jgi:hypothetical protein